VDASVESTLTNVDDDMYLVDCESGVCEQTSGYVKKSNTVVYEFSGDNTGVTVSSTVAEVGTCTDTVGSSNLGKIYTSTGEVTGICVGSDGGTGKGMAFEATGEYLILKGRAVSGTPFESNSLSVPLKSGNNYIISDKFFTGGNNNNNIDVKK